MTLIYFAEYGLYQFFPAVTGQALFRYRLWDIDIVINRVLEYGSLTLLTMRVYLATVTILGSLFSTVADPVLFFLATGEVAIIFEPLRQRLQRLVNRLFMVSATIRKLC
jgi:hypothetical protein